MAVLYAGSEAESSLQLGSAYLVDTSGSVHDAAYTRWASVTLDSTRYMACDFNAAATDFWFHALYYHANTNTTSGSYFLTFNDGSSPRIRFKNETAASGFLKFSVEKTADGSTWTAVSSGNYFLSKQATLQALDIHLVTGVSGQLTITINNELVFDFTGNLTVFTDINRAVLSAPSTTDGFNWSEVCASTTCAQLAKLFTSTPDATGTYSQWTNTYTEIDDNPSAEIDLTDFISNDVIGQHSTFNTVDFSGSLTGKKVEAVILSSKGTIQAGSTATNLKHLTRTNSTDFLSGNLNPPTNGTAKAMQTVYALNPQTSSNWTLSELNALEYGVETV